MRLRAAEVAQAAGGIIIAGSEDTIVTDISTDSNKMKEGDLFVPIIGARTDAHKYILGAAAHGAVAAFSAYDLDKLSELAGMSTKEFAAQHLTIIKVDNTLAALQSLGAYYRQQYVHIPYVGVTGSVGKTTCREMIASALSASYKVYSTKGNANSQTGVPITVTETEEDAEIGVIEMGISEFGEMSRLSKVVQCDTAVFTVIGVSHIANLGSRDNILREKLHILDCIHEGGTLILNGDDDMLSREDVRAFFPEGTDSKNIRIIYYGTGDKAFVRAADISEEDSCYSYMLHIDGEPVTRVKLSVAGEHMLLNSLAALTCAYVHGADIQKAAQNLGDFKSLDGRGRIYESRGIKVINDAYNAAPQSVKAGLKVLDNINTEGRRIAVLADMLELGEDEARYHSEVGAFISSDTPNIDIVMLYGGLMKYTAEGIKQGFCEEPGRHMPWVYCFDSLEELKKELEHELYAGDAVLFKGSNAMKLGELARELCPSDETIEKHETESNTHGKTDRADSNVRETLATDQKTGIDDRTDTDSTGKASKT